MENSKINLLMNVRKSTSRVVTFYIEGLLIGLSVYLTALAMGESADGAGNLMAGCAVAFTFLATSTNLLISSRSDDSMKNMVLPFIADVITTIMCVLASKITLINYTADVNGLKTVGMCIAIILATHIAVFGVMKALLYIREAKSIDVHRN